MAGDACRVGAEASTSGRSWTEHERSRSADQEWIDEVVTLIIKPRTLRHRESDGKPLSPAESERILRLVRIISIAESVFGDRHKALRWLRQPKRRLAGRAPIQILSTEPGGRLVEQMLAQIDEGMFA
jgi:putative toxin-antitoxin system antitoxin component (TIGR02293 family)